MRPRPTSIRLTEEELEAVDRATRTVGCASRSAFIRKVVLAVAERIGRGEPEEREEARAH